MSQNKHVPIYKRPIRRKIPTKMSDIDFYIGVGDFGKTSTKVGIGYSRKEEKPPPPSPGPGQYDPPPHPISTAIPHRITTSHETIRDCMTTNIDFIEHRIFPESHDFSIGHRSKLSIDYTVETPSPSYFNVSCFSKPKISIGSRREEKPLNNNPSPTAYKIIEDQVYPRSPAYTLSGPLYRDDWITSTDETPSPGDYNPHRPVTLIPSWTLGKRSRYSKKRKVIEKLTPFAVGSFVVKLDSFVTVEEAQVYVESHPEIKSVVNEIFEVIYEAKPSNPIQFLTNYFLSQKSLPAPNLPKRKKSSLRKLYLTSLKPPPTEEYDPFNY